VYDYLNAFYSNIEINKKALSNDMWMLNMIAKNKLPLKSAH